MEPSSGVIGNGVSVVGVSVRSFRLPNGIFSKSID